MAVTVTKMAVGPAKGARSVAMAAGSAKTTWEVYKLAFDTSYPTGGEDISSIINEWKDILWIGVATFDITIADRREYIIDKTNKKIIVLDAFNTEEGDTTDLSTLTDVRLLVVGYKK